MGQEQVPQVEFMQVASKSFEAALPNQLRSTSPQAPSQFSEDDRKLRDMLKNKILGNHDDVMMDRKIERVMKVMMAEINELNQNELLHGLDDDVAVDDNEGNYDTCVQMVNLNDLQTTTHGRRESVDSTHL